MSESPVSRVRAVFESLRPEKLEEGLVEMARLYHPDVEFRDPVQHTRGLDAFLLANRRFVGMCRDLGIVFHDQVESPQSACMVWTLRMTFPLGRTAIMDGVSHLKLDAAGLVVHHRDYWDGLSSFAHVVPGAAGLLTAAIERFGSHRR